jgi:predicted small lipoprotein YifL
MLRLLLLLVPLVFGLTSLSGCRRAPPLEAPPAAVITALQRGINLGMWTDERDLDALHAAQFNPDDSDLERIRALGLRHVRVGFDPRWLATAEGDLKPEALARLRADLQRLQQRGLFVVLSMQPQSADKQRLAKDEQALARLAKLWRALAKALVSTPNTALAFELLNEPEIEDPAQVRAQLEVLSSAVRAAAPQHTLIAQGPRYSDPEDLAKLTPLDDRNVVYSFHFYEPKNFTHQGVPYGWPMWGLLRDLPYPSSPETVEPALAFMPFEALEHARFYGEQRWNRDKLAAALEPVAAWAVQHRVPIWCSEFGVFRYHAKPEDRAAWLSDTRTLLEQRGIGWALWDYSGYFGLVSGPQGQRVVDRLATEALGLHSP